MQKSEFKFHSFNYIFVAGQHPMVKGETVRATACFGRDTFTIDTHKFKCQFSQEVLIRNCGDFFIYYLPEVETCHLRYCSV